MSLTAGSRLDPYQIAGSLGAGRMGDVYRARDTRLDRTVAASGAAGELTIAPVDSAPTRQQPLN